MILHPLDLTVIGIYLTAMVALGFWLRRQQSSLRHYFLADRSMRWPIITLSIVATETSTVTFLSIPAITYAEGGNLGFLQIALGYIAGRFLVCGIFLKSYFSGDTFTSYEILHQRFGQRVKETASILFLITRSLSDGLRLFLTALALQTVLSPLFDGPSFGVFAFSVLTIGCLTICCTLMGGIRAVFWMDASQFFVYMTGACVALFLLIDFLGGNLFQFVTFGLDTGRLQLFDFSINHNIYNNPNNFWVAFTGGAILSTATHGTDQLMVQRYLAAQSQRHAAIALRLSGIVVFLQFFVFLLIGIGLAAYYQQAPPQHPFQRTDEVFARFLVEKMPVGLRGLVFAGVFSAAMSTLSSSLNSSATTSINDLYVSRKRKTRDDPSLLPLAKQLTVFWGLVQMVVAFVAITILQRDVITSVLTITGFTTGITLGLFLLAFTNQHIRPLSALWAMVFGTIGMTLIWQYTHLAWPLYSLAASLITYVSGTLIQLLFDGRKNHDNPETNIANSS
ncbi:MAG: sodium/solute symporter [Planctomycetota bacterium]|nr:sodium/solute symporter [Planctomycetota bacterium]